MTTRRRFISAAAAAIGVAAIGDTSNPQPAQAATKGPSTTALAVARSLQETLPEAKLSDELVEKIAGDIDGYASTAADFRKGALRNWDEPDFVFTAGLSS